jgi:hypothetical protein
MKVRGLPGMFAPMYRFPNASAVDEDDRPHGASRAARIHRRRRYRACVKFRIENSTLGRLHDLFGTIELRWDALALSARPVFFCSSPAVSTRRSTTTGCRAGTAESLPRPISVGEAISALRSWSVWSRRGSLVLRFEPLIARRLWEMCLAA